MRFAQSLTVMAVTALLGSARPTTRASSTGGLHGRVTTRQQVPISGAQLHLIPVDGDADAARAAVTDSLGGFAWSGLPGGEYHLVVRRLGFRPVDVGVHIEEGIDRYAAIVLVRTTPLLDTVSVTAASILPSPSGRSTAMDAFYERQRKGVGHFITREDIENHSPSTLGSLLQRVSGIEVSTHGDGTLTVQSSNCRASSLRTQSKFVDDWGGVALYVDGSRVPDSDRRAFSGTLTPDQIEAIEVYRSPTELPAEAVGNACSAVYIWTRSGAAPDSVALARRGEHPNAATPPSRAR